MFRLQGEIWSHFEQAAALPPVAMVICLRCVIFILSVLRFASIQSWEYGNIRAYFPGVSLFLGHSVAFLNEVQYTNLERRANERVAVRESQPSCLSLFPSQVKHDADYRHPLIPQVCDLHRSSWCWWPRSVFCSRHSAENDPRVTMGLGPLQASIHIFCSPSSDAILCFSVLSQSRLSSADTFSRSCFDC